MSSTGNAKARAGKKTTPVHEKPRRITSLAQLTEGANRRRVVRFPLDGAEVEIELTPLTAVQSERVAAFTDIAPPIDESRRDDMFGGANYDDPDYKKAIREGECKANALQIAMACRELGIPADESIDVIREEIYGKLPLSVINLLVDEIARISTARIDVLANFTSADESGSSPS